MCLRRPVVFTHGGSPLSGAGSPLPFPLRSDLGNLADRHGAGVTSARPHLCLNPQRSSFPLHIVRRDPRQTPQPQPALGAAIRESREKRGLSQEALAGQAGITPNTLSLIEQGKANPTWGTVRGIASALGVSVSALAKLAEKLDK